MSLGEIQEVYTLLQQIDQMLGSIETKTQKLEKNAPHTAEFLFTASETLRVFWRLSGLLSRMGLPKEISQATRALNMFAHTVLIAYTATRMLMLGTPYGWVMGGIGVATTLLSVGTAANALEGY